MRKKTRKGYSMEVSLKVENIMRDDATRSKKGRLVADEIA